MPVEHDAVAIEQFHLTFLRVFSSAHRPDQYVLKGGANLRYFFDSVRYSNDIDFGSVAGDRWKLEQAIDGVLGGKALGSILRISGMRVVEFSKPKQTDTTQRWKVGLEKDGRAATIRTKIEFSRRVNDHRFEMVQIPQRIVDPYGIVPPTVQRYGLTAMIEQKVATLALRGETKARDVFDLDLLLRQRSKLAEPAEVYSKHFTDAAERALQLPFSSFETQVLPFLDPAIAALYSEPQTWEGMKAFVSERIGALGASPQQPRPPGRRHGFGGLSK